MRFVQFLLRYSTLKALSAFLLVLGLVSQRWPLIDGPRWLPNLLVLCGFLGISAVQYLQLTSDKKRIDFLLQLLVIFVFLVLAGIFMEHAA